MADATAARRLSLPLALLGRTQRFERLPVGNTRPDASAVVGPVASRISGPPVVRKSASIKPRNAGQQRVPPCPVAIRCTLTGP